MYNYIITRISPRYAFCCMLFTGIIIGGMLGIVLGIMEQEAVGFTGGAFIGLLTGLFSGFIGFIFAITFNALTPITKGLPIAVEKCEETTPSNTPTT